MYEFRYDMAVMELLRWVDIIRLYLCPVQWKSGTRLHEFQLRLQHSRDSLILVAYSKTFGPVYFNFQTKHVFFMKQSKHKALRVVLLYYIQCNNSKRTIPA